MKTLKCATLNIIFIPSLLSNRFKEKNLKQLIKSERARLEMEIEIKQNLRNKKKRLKKKNKKQVEIEE